MREIDHYMDICLRADRNFSATHLMNALFLKLHHALAKAGSTDIGVSFPDVNSLRPSLGERLRLHGHAKALESLSAQDWTAGMLDHALVGHIACVPAGASYKHVRRVQAKSSPERLRRRQMKRHNLSEEQACAQIPPTAARRLSMPYLTLPSHSTGQTFRLFIDHIEAPIPAIGNFNTYGLSRSATVPWF